MSCNLAYACYSRASSITSPSFRTTKKASNHSRRVSCYHARTSRTRVAVLYSETPHTSSRSCLDTHPHSKDRRVDRQTSTTLENLFKQIGTYVELVMSKSITYFAPDPTNLVGSSEALKRAPTILPEVVATCMMHSLVRSSIICDNLLCGMRWLLRPV